MPDTYNWLLDIPFWEADARGDESKVFALEDFLTRSNRPSERAWYVHFRQWCQRRRSGCLDLYDARSIGQVHGVEMMVVTRCRKGPTLN